MSFLHRHLATVIYIVAVAFSFSFLFYGQQRQEHLVEGSCLRGNVIRAQLNYTGSVLRNFIVEAATAREQSAAKAEHEGDPAAARIDRDTAAAYRALLPGFTPLPLVDCNHL